MRMLAAVGKVVEGEADQEKWRLLLRGLWASGMRLGEALKLRWHAGPIHVDMSSAKPLLRFSGSHQKNRKDQVAPAVPEFAGLMDELPGDTGHVCDIDSAVVHLDGKTCAVPSRRGRRRRSRDYGDRSGCSSGRQRRRETRIGARSPTRVRCSLVG